MNAMTDVYLHHGALSVSNMARSIQFYESVLGFSVDTRLVVQDGNLEIVHLKKGSSYLELFCRRGVAPLPEHAADHERDLWVVGTKHVAFCTANPDAVHAGLTRCAVAGLTPIFDGTYYKYFFFKDPDGIVLEIVSRKRQGLGHAAANETEPAKLK
jgi:catechol 2,3-dioxygenase-like lactoylglutathione lyase family enzyme